MDLRRFKTAGWPLTLAVGLGASYARADGPQRDGSGSQPTVERQGGGAMGGDRRSSGAPSSIAASTQINEIFTAVAPSGCVYGVMVRGSIRLVRPAIGEDVKYSPNLLVSAWVTCQGKSGRGRDTALRETSMSRTDLEQALTLRGLVLSGAAPHRCAYVPEVVFDDGGLSVQGISYLCATNRPEDAAAAIKQPTPDAPPLGADKSDADAAESHPTELAVEATRPKDVSSTSTKAPHLTGQPTGRTTLLARGERSNGNASTTPAATVPPIANENKPTTGIVERQPNEPSNETGGEPKPHQPPIRPAP